MLDKREYDVNIVLILHGNIGCGYSLEAPLQGASNEYTLPMFSWRNKKKMNPFWLKSSPLELPS